MNYSLFGDPERRYRRFLYNGYLPSDHPEQGVRFELTAEKLRQLNEKSNRMVLQVEDTLKKVFNDRIWPVDRRIIISTAECFLNALERVKCFLQIYTPEKVRFFTPYDPSDLQPAPTVDSYISRLLPEIYERIVISILTLNGVEIMLEHSSTGLNKIKRSRAKNHLLHLRKHLLTLWTKYNFRKDLRLFRPNKDHQKRKKLLVINGYVDDADLEICRERANILHLINWHRSSEPALIKEIENFIKASDTHIVREQWEKALREIKLDNEDAILEDVIPFIAKVYPASLIEGRNYLAAHARNYLKEMRCPEDDCKDIVLSIDHGLWKYESLSALSNELIRNGGSVAASSHDRCTGLNDYSLTLTLDQCLATHYFSNFKTPFIYTEKETPKVIQVDSLKKYLPTIRDVEEKDMISIWYLPHYLPLDPEFQFWSYGFENPESFFYIQENVLKGLNKIANHDNVKEIVIKLKHHSERLKEKERYIIFSEELLGNSRSKKIRFEINMTIQQAIPYMSIAVHDFFSSGFIETIYAGVPTITFLSPETEVPYRFPDREDWIKSGVFVRNKDQLYESLLRWVEGRVPPNYQRMKENFLITCGLGSATNGQALKTIMESI